MEDSHLKCGEDVADVSLYVRSNGLVEDTQELFDASSPKEPEPNGAILEIQGQLSTEKTLGERGKFPAPADGHRFDATTAFPGDDGIALETELVSTQQPADQVRP